MVFHPLKFLINISYIGIYTYNIYLQICPNYTYNIYLQICPIQKGSFLRLRNLSYVYENHVQRNAMTGIRSSMKMTPRCGSRMISKAERRLERHRRDYMGRVHVYTLLSALPRIFPSLPVSSDLRLHPFSSSSFCYFFLPLYDERASRTVYIHTSDRLFVASVPKDYFQPTTFVFRSVVR